MTLDVSGGEFATAMQRLQFVAREVEKRLPLAVECPVTLDHAAATVLDMMHMAQVRGWPLGARIVELLRFACGPAQG